MLLKRGFFSLFAVMLTALFVGVDLYAAAPVNPRESSGGTSRRNTTTNVTEKSRNAAKSRVAQTRAIAGRSRVAVLPRTGNSSRVAIRPEGAVVSRAVRTASSRVSAARSAGLIGGVNVSRAGKARATAVFSDISKIGGGYANCRESYSTCMDQMCANANDTYRRCFCSERFTKFRDTENALDQAMLMLRQFEDNNLNAVDKTAAEVSAMYSATVGEMAIKKDTSASAQVLESIGDLLSGKVKATSQSTSEALGLLDFSVDLDDVWGGENSLFSDNRGQDMSTMEGLALFNTAQKQCVSITQSQCENDAVFNMAKSSYNILIAQDCNLYEKTLNKKRQNVEDAVRQAEKYLRDARLEEYRSHNSASVNECISKVRATMLTDTACGENYKRCLDPTGAFISAATGEPIYTPRLFELENTIQLDGKISGDVLQQNSNFNKFLDSMRKRVDKDLDTCRDDAEYVWTEFKRAALIEIAQAQSEKLEEVRMSCVNTISECYDTQTNSLNDFDSTTAKNSAALARGTARSMCAEKVIACAALFGSAKENEKCTFDGRGHFIGDEGTCGLTKLLQFVDNVDSTKIAEGCDTAIRNYLKELCTPSTGGEYPYKCRNMKFDDAVTAGDGSTARKEDTLKAKVLDFATQNCSGISDSDTKRIDEKVQLALNDLAEDMRYVLSNKCTEDYDGKGYWFDNKDLVANDTKRLESFYHDVFGGYDASKSSTWDTWGICVENSVRIACESFNSDNEKLTRYNNATGDCEFYDAWYTSRCELAGGFYEAGVCYIP
ncbi:MAG: hypothetical protein K6B71_02670 [Alphaproteobacteria bacterium]|nr:hypothetical protein [Alphaproteobacteria bacterium]